MANVIQIKRSESSSASGITLAAGELAFGNDNVLFIGHPDGKSPNVAIGGDGNFVDVSTDQSVSGVKTFNSSPVVPNGAAGTQAVNAGQVQIGLDLKSNRVTGGGTDGNLAGLDTNGDLTNSGITTTAVVTSASSINKLADVNTNGIADGKVLVASGGSWVIGDAEDPTTIQNGNNKVVASPTNVTITSDTDVNINTGVGGSLNVSDGGADGVVTATGGLTLSAGGDVQITGATTKIGAVTYPSNAGTAGQLVVLTANDTIGYGNATTGVISDFPTYGAGDDGKYLSVTSDGTSTEFATIDSTEVTFDGGVEANVDAAIVAVRAEAAAAQDKADDAIPATEKGANDGVATLDGTGQIPESQLPGSVLGAVAYQGTWNASTAAPAPDGRAVRQGDYWIVGSAGSTSLDGIADWEIGDWAIHNGTSWGKVDNSEPDITAGGVSYNGGQNYNLGGGETVESALDNLDTAIGNNDTDIATIKGSAIIDAGINDIAGLDGRLGTAETNITELTNDTTGDSAAETSYDGSGVNYISGTDNVKSALNALDAQAKTNANAASTADGKAVAAQGDASQALTNAATADSKAVTAQSTADTAATAVGTTFDPTGLKSISGDAGNVQLALGEVDAKISSIESDSAGLTADTTSYTVPTNPDSYLGGKNNVQLALDELDVQLFRVDGVSATAVQSVNGKSGTAVTITKGDVGLSNVSNTAPADLPISTDTQDALNLKADLVSPATVGNFAGLDASGNLTDSGSKSSDFATAAQGATADNAVQSVSVPVGEPKTGTSITLTTTDFGLENVANLAPADLPVSTAQQTEIDTKVDLLVGGTVDNFVLIGEGGQIKISTVNESTFATAAQGDLADTALQPADVANFTLDGGTF